MHKDLLTRGIYGDLVTGWTAETNAVQDLVERAIDIATALDGWKTNLATLPPCHLGLRMMAILQHLPLKRQRP
jgi:hypothetical protein